MVWKKSVGWRAMRRARYLLHPRCDLLVAAWLTLVANSVFSGWRFEDVWLNSRAAYLAFYAKYVVGL